MSDIRTIRGTLAAAALLAVAAGGACAGDHGTTSGATGSVAARAAADTAPTAAEDTSYRQRPGYVVDSALTHDELLRRFRAGTSRREALEGGASSREALVTQVFEALANRDTAGLRALVVTRDEFAWLVFPSSPLAGPPYNQRPEVAWLLREAASDKGMHRLLRRSAEAPYRYRSHDCPRAPEIEGRNRVHRGCTVRVRRGAREVELRLFGAIVERAGRWKLLGYDNDL